MLSTSDTATSPEDIYGDIRMQVPLLLCSTKLNTELKSSRLRITARAAASSRLCWETSASDVTVTTDPVKTSYSYLDSAHATTCKKPGGNYLSYPHHIINIFNLFIYYEVHVTETMMDSGIPSLFLSYQLFLVKV